MMDKNIPVDLLDFYSNTKKYIGADNEKILCNIFNTIPSSFNNNEFWRIFYYIGKYISASSICELGVLNGYSLIALAFGDLSEGGKKKIFGYDLFDDYPFNRGSKEGLDVLINKFNIDNIELIKRNLVDENYKVKLPMEAGIYVIDLSNCGEILSSSLKQINWEKTKLVIFEGGSIDRDTIPWMVKYKRKPIYTYLEEINEDYFIYISNKFPSLTFVFKEDYRKEFGSFFDIKMEKLCKNM
ncbi:hypothetical protein HOB87_07120 [Candidatus Woesearchaeota archaeon]|jgi:hypothetical protein|nr:hypothetical protein [Candidatus Woesearchaeota archaeon]